MQDLMSLKQQYDLPNCVTFNAGEGGLSRCEIVAGGATAEIYLHGATLVKYQRKEETPLIFCSETSPYRAEKAIRGGVPICFPWFGPHPQNPKLPQHGFARTALWSVSRTTENRDGSATVVFSLKSSEATRALWNFEFEALYIVTVGAELTLGLTVTNTGVDEFQYEEALHTYLQVSDVRDITIEGLGNASYSDKTDGGKLVESHEPTLQLSQETDRVYLNTRSVCILRDPDFRDIYISKSGSDCTVVWNPWETKAEAMVDLSGGQWRKFVCVEAVNSGSFAVSLKPGESHTLTTTIE